MAKYCGFFVVRRMPSSRGLADCTVERGLQFALPMKARSLLHLVAPFAALTAVAAIASGGSPDDGTFNGTANPNDPQFNTGDGGPGNLGGGDGGLQTPDDLAKCATANAKPEALPVKLVVMYDKSGSMSQDSKWSSCKTGFTSFFADPKTKGISASLSFFPQGSQCNPVAFSTPTVPMRALPDSATFSGAINGQSPNGGTPTLPAIQGAIQYAKSLGANETSKVAIVLVTDGEPNDCSSTVQGVSNEVQAAYQSSSIPTYVVGVGNVNNLNAIAAAGGTKQATIVSTNNPAQTAQDFQNALDTIRGMVLACEYTIPPPPQGKAFEPGKVNIVFTPTNSIAQTLTYNPDCTGGTGWRYDDPKSPKKILLCGNTCDTVQKDKSGIIDVVLGCTTHGPAVN